MIQLKKFIIIEKEKRRDYEAKTNTKSTLSKAEDNIESTKS